MQVGPWQLGLAGFVNALTMAPCCLGVCRRPRLVQQRYYSNNLTSPNPPGVPRRARPGYIFPAGFKSRLVFRSSVELESLCVHECEIIGEVSRGLLVACVCWNNPGAGAALALCLRAADTACCLVQCAGQHGKGRHTMPALLLWGLPMQGGEYWPQPTFKVTALDRPQDPVVAKSCTGCWSGVGALPTVFVGGGEWGLSTGLSPAGAPSCRCGAQQRPQPNT